MLYIHIPYCKKKCIYCNFYSGGNPDWKKYLKAVASELSQRIDELRGDSLSSVYIGGGTPSLIPATLFPDFIRNIWSILDKENIPISNNVEVTLEVNPEDVSEEMAVCWKSNYVNRISMGVQSLEDSELLLLNRRHSAAKVEEAMESLSRNFDNISLDLIYGIPGQTIESLSNTLNKAIGFNPNHISLYSLTYESKTPLSLLRDKGAIQECNEDLSLEMANFASSILNKNGYERYEISNFSRHGFQSNHNSGYWTGKPYLGLGPSACSFDGVNIRRSNPGNIKHYLDHFATDNITGSKFYEEDILSAEERREEVIFISLRTRNGINLRKFETEFGTKEKDKLVNNAKRWILSGDMSMKEDRLYLKEKGINLSDYIILSLI